MGRQKLQLRNKAIKKGLDPESFTQKPSHHSHVLQVRKKDRHQNLRRQEKAVRRWCRGHQSRSTRSSLEGEVRRMVKETKGKASQMVRSSPRQKRRRGGGRRINYCCSQSPD